MKRRNFLTGLGPLAVAPIVTLGNTSETTADNRQYIEWLKYTLQSGSNKGRVENYYQEAAIPALNKLGIKNVGVFSVVYGPNDPSLYVMIPHNHIETVMSYQDQLLDDADYMKAAKDFIDSEISSPAYIRVERGLMRAFAGMPQVESPKESKGATRIVEMRRYESHNYIKAQKKIDMFNNAGEIQIFRDTGLTPVFFGETLFGPMMPNLTYMVAFKDIAERDKSWGNFGSSDGWAAIKDLEEYKDTVSNITDIIMRPARCSQI